MGFLDPRRYRHRRLPGQGIGNAQSGLAAELNHAQDKVLEDKLINPKFLAAALAFLLVAPAAAQVSEPDLDDMPAKLVKSTSNYDYEKRVVMIPMRDGVKLYTVMIIPKGARNAPIVLTRTPYDAAKRAQSTGTPYCDMALAHSDEWMTE